MSNSSSNNDRPLRGVWRATVFAKRKEGVSNEEFSVRFARHAKLAGPVMVKHNALSYVQVCLSENVVKLLIANINRSQKHHILQSHKVRLSTLLGPELAPHITFTDADGIVTSVFPSAEDMSAFFRDEAHATTLNADVAEFADVTTVTLGIGDELVVVEGGKILV